MTNNFSPNMLKTYTDCPKKFYYRYVEKLNVPVSSEPFEKGKKIHALANYYLRGTDISRIETALTPEERTVWQKLLNNPYFGKECFKSEYSLSCRLKNFWTGGRIDAIVRDFDEYYILDYKTGAVPKNPEYDYQTMVYLLCVDRFLKTYDGLSFVYIDLKNDKNRVIKFTDGLRYKYEQILTDICQTINEDTMYFPNENNCKFCEYSKFCNNS